MPGSKSTAIIWDMDGVIVDTAPYHFKSWRYVFRKRGIDFTEADFKRKFGQRNDAIIRSTIGSNIADNEMEAIAREKEEYFRRIVWDNVKPLPGATELIKTLAEQGFKMAVASSAPPENIQLLLGSLGITGCFQQVVSGREVTESKPSPQIFLLAAKKLGVAPENCIVIEDAIAGVAAAKKAGMFCIAVTTTNPRESLREADLVIDNLAELRVISLEQLIATGGGTK